ncbi:hypothetical protein UFOVP353_5 [uncultured Caudovirales phage]|uniref:Uncharacterized protein n=1 Tax=uncultured Caudovirales phage TaxID=2100421 RepID=A0A6J5M2X0_9CAUD|nr:hypothetical protein UFOVP353_5 [uncultured Caudovirales phage]
MAIYPVFEIKAVKDEVKSAVEGRVVYDDVEYVSIRVDQKTKIDKPAAEWLGELDYKLDKGRIDPGEYQRFRRIYEAFKSGQEAPLDGTDIRGWPLVTPAQVENFRKIGVRTLEDLIKADENTIKEAGSGARELQKKATAYIEAAKDGKAAEKIVALENAVNQLSEQNVQLMNELKNQLEAKEAPKKGRPPKAA